jgi:hypothetical protein
VDVCVGGVCVGDFVTTALATTVLRALARPLSHAANQNPQQTSAMSHMIDISEVVFMQGYTIDNILL